MSKLFVDKFDEMEAEETGGMSPYGVQLLQQILTKLVDRVGALEKEVEELKKPPQITYAYGNYTGMPISGCMIPGTTYTASNLTMQEAIDELGNSEWWYTTTGIDEGDRNV